MNKLTAIVVGAGGRGTNAYAPYALQHPHQLEIVGVAEPNPHRRQYFASQHNLPDSMCFQGYEQIFAAGRIADIAIICTADQMHIQPFRMAVEKGYHILLEKPMSSSIDDSVEIAKTAANYDKVVSVCHVLRYTPFFSTLKSLLDQGRIGRLISIQHNENVGFWHQAHSFVRGTFRSSMETSPMILAKCCHDMDILLYLTGNNCKKLASFGNLTYFKPQNAPKGSADRCVNCALADSCIYNCIKFYTEPKNIDWTFALDCGVPTNENIMEALQTHRLGRCVFRCDNDVVDHQVISMEFEDDITAVFTMCGFTQECSRTIKLMGTHGEIGADAERNIITIKDFLTGIMETIKVYPGQAGHGGGDQGIMQGLLAAINGSAEDKTSASISLQSHMMAYAAEKSRIESTVIDIKGFIDSYMME